MSATLTEISDDVREMMKRYDVKLRKANSKVTHAAYGTTTELTPVQFAWYQIAITCAYLRDQYGFQALPRGVKRDMMVNHALRSEAWHWHLARKDGFQMPRPKRVAGDKAKELFNQTVDDAARVTQLIAEAGLYYKLLD